MAHFDGVMASPPCDRNERGVWDRMRDARSKMNRETGYKLTWTQFMSALISAYENREVRDQVMYNKGRDEAIKKTRK